MTGIKKNPNHFPIIDKWNRRIYERNKFAIFDIVSDVLEGAYKEVDFSNMTDIRKVE